MKKLIYVGFVVAVLMTLGYVMWPSGPSVPNTQVINQANKTIPMQNTYSIAGGGDTI